MSATLNPAARPPRALEVGPLIAAAGVAGALAIGMALGVPTTESRVLGVFAIGLIAMVAATAWPFTALRIMMFSAYLLVVWIVFGTRSINFIDIFMGPVLIASLASGARHRAREEEASLQGTAHLAIRAATRKLRRAVALFYACAIASLVALALRGHPGWAGESALMLFRGFQGLFFFALGLWWLRTQRQVRSVVSTLQFAGWCLLALNSLFFVLGVTRRAGMTWLVNFPDWPMTSPNEAAVTLLPIWALLSALPETARRPWHAALRVGLLVMMIMTQSRSGLVAWSLYLMMSVNWGRWRTLAIAVLMGVGAALFVPSSYWERLAHTAALRGGSFDAFSSLMRFYSWQSALRSIAAHPIFGVGYLGFRFISADYNDLHAFVGTESYYFEVAVGMGIIGLVLLARVIAALFRLGDAVLRNTPSGTYGNRLARQHGPLMVALLAANLTADNFIGMVGLGQLAIWCAILVRSGHLEVRSPELS